MTTTAKPARPEPLWSVEDVARFLGKSVQTLYAWRVRGIGPPARKLGKHLRYRREDVELWLETQKR